MYYITNEQYIDYDEKDEKLLCIVDVYEVSEANCGKKGCNIKVISKQSYELNDNGEFLPLSGLYGIVEKSLNGVSVDKVLNSIEDIKLYLLSEIKKTTIVRLSKLQEEVDYYNERLRLCSI